MSQICWEIAATGFIDRVLENAPDYTGLSLGDVREMFPRFPQD
jgi:hypothetical protein